MWRARFTILVLILGWLVTPDVLCLIPGIDMTAGEHECCERMGSDCGKIPMPDMQSCCSTSTPTQAVIVTRTTDYPEQRGLTAPAVIPDVDLVYNSPQNFYWNRFESPSPPPLVARSSFDILRI